MAVLAPVPTASSDDDKDPSLGLTITFAGDFQDLTSTQRDDVPPQDLPESSIIYDEQFEDRPSAILQPFEAEPARGLFGNFDEVFFYDMVVGEPDSVLTNPVMDVAPEDLIDIALVTSSFAQNFDGPPDVSTGLFCWGAGTDGSGIPDQSRYELRVQPDRRMVVDRVDPDGQISARLIEITLPLPPDRATFARLGCRRGAGGRVEIIAGYTQGEEGDTLYNIDPQPLRPGGTAGILMRTGENPVSASTFISFVQLVLFDANAIVLGE